MKCEAPAFASLSSREPAPIQNPSETERTCASRSEITRSPESSSVSTYFCCTAGSYSRRYARAVEPDETFELAVETAIDALPADLRTAMSNVAIVVEDEPPAGQPLLGLYEGIPLTARSSAYSGATPDKISIYRG